MREIFQAIAGGQKAKVIGLLKRDPSLFQSLTEEGITPVLFSLYYGKLDISKEIYEISPDRNLFEAAALGDPEETKRLLSGSSDTINSLSHDGWSALHLASYFGHLEIVRLLISSGADLGITSKSKLSYGNTALHSAVATEKKPSWNFFWKQARTLSKIRAGLLLYTSPRIALEKSNVIEAQLLEFT